MEFLYKLIASVFCQAFSCFCFFLLRSQYKHAIVEAGYRNDTRLRKPQSKKLPLWDRVIFWELSKSAKRNHKAVWIYFGFNLAVSLAWACSPVLCVICLCSMELRELLLWQLGYPLTILVVMTMVQFPFDLAYLPSVRKRYPMCNKTKEK